MMRFRVVFGVVPGYSHDNECAELDPEQVVGRAWSVAMENELERSNILVGATVQAGRVFYPGKFGCPKDGEKVGVVEGDANPKFVGGMDQPTLNAWSKAVIRVVSMVRKSLGQERVQLTFSGNDTFVYLEPDSPNGEQRWGF